MEKSSHSIHEINCFCPSWSTGIVDVRYVVVFFREVWQCVENCNNLGLLDMDLEIIKSKCEKCEGRLHFHRKLSLNGFYISGVAFNFFFFL